MEVPHGVTAILVICDHVKRDTMVGSEIEFKLSAVRDELRAGENDPWVTTS